MKVPKIANKAELVEFIRHCAWQERTVSRIGRKSKAVIAEHERAAKAIETIANLLESES